MIKTIATLLFIFLIQYLLLLLENVWGINGLFVGFMLALYFFLSATRQLALILVFGFLHDVFHFLPLGSSFVFLAPFIWYFPPMAKQLKSRMLAFGLSLFVLSLGLAFYEAGRLLPDEKIVIGAILNAVFWTVGLYALKLRRPSFQSFAIRRQTIHFGK